MQRSSGGGNAVTRLRPGENNESVFALWISRVHHAQPKKMTLLQLWTLSFFLSFPFSFYIGCTRSFSIITAVDRFCKMNFFLNSGILKLLSGISPCTVSHQFNVLIRRTVNCIHSITANDANGACSKQKKKNSRSGIENE